VRRRAPRARRRTARTALRTGSARAHRSRRSTTASGRGTSGQSSGRINAEAPTSTTTGSRATSSMSNVAATGPNSSIPAASRRPLASRVASRLALKNDRRPSTASGLACASSLPSAPRKAVCSSLGWKFKGHARGSWRWEAATISSCTSAAPDASPAAIARSCWRLTAGRSFVTNDSGRNSSAKFATA